MASIVFNQYRGVGEGIWKCQITKSFSLLWLAFGSVKTLIASSLQTFRLEQAQAQAPGQGWAGNWVAGRGPIVWGFCRGIIWGVK